MEELLGVIGIYGYGQRESRRELSAKNLSRGWCIGGAEFRKEMREEALNKGAFLDLSRFAGIEPDRFDAERREIWEERLQELAKAANVDLAQLPTQKSAPSKVLLAAALKQSTSVSNGWLAERLQMGKAASASQFVRRAKLDSKTSKKIEKILSRVKT
jgi:hypothetical protein